MSSEIEYIDPKLLKFDPNQPRRPDWDSTKIKEKQESLAKSYEGTVDEQLHPIEVRARARKRGFRSTN